MKEHSRTTRCFALVALTVLCTSGCKSSASELAPIEFCGDTLEPAKVKVTVVFCADPQVTSLEPLAPLPDLVRLYIRGTSVRDLSPVPKAKLRILTAGGKTPLDLRTLAGFNELRQLELQGSEAEDLTPVAGLTKLEAIDISRTGVSDLGPLAGLSKLEWIRAEYTYISELAPLATLYSLDYLNVSSNLVRDVESLAAIPSLKELYLDHTLVDDEEAVLRLKSLRPGGLESLTLSNTRISNKACQRLAKEMPSVSLTCWRFTEAGTGRTLEQRIERARPRHKPR